MATLTAHQIRQIAVEARRDPRTVRAVIERRARGVSDVAIREAADRLGIRLPVAEGAHAP
jgi:hypothetical protein